MNEPAPDSFERTVFSQLDRKLRDTGWGSGVPEAHGLLTGLACRGIPVAEITNKLYLFRLDSDRDSAMMEALYELIVRNLDSDSPVFDLMLPEDDESVSLRADEIGNWCSGFVQGFCHDGDLVVHQCGGSVRELIRDIMAISGMQSASPDGAGAGQGEEKALVEVEQYLRVGIQLIYEEMVANPKSEQAAGQS